MISGTHGTDVLSAAWVLYVLFGQAPRSFAMDVVIVGGMVN